MKIPFSSITKMFLLDRVIDVGYLNFNWDWALIIFDIKAIINRFNSYLKYFI